MRRHAFTLQLIALLCGSANVVADFKDDIGYNRLLAEQGANTPDGTGVAVTHVEPESGTPPAYMPNVADAQFDGKTITNISNTNSDDSGHATSSGKTFYGNTSSIAPAISEINVYNADYWLQPNFVRVNDWQNRKPLDSSDRIGSHSWVGSFGSAADDSNALRRVDWIVETDEFIQCVGIKNSSNLNSSLLSGAYNVIAVGKSDGLNGYGSRQLDSDYISGRVRPELVVPKSTSSQATPTVASAVALLVEAGHTSPCPGTDPVQSQTTNRAGDTICNAERSEVIKAVLMAGADRITSNSSSADISDYRAIANQTGNGLDDRYGAGQLNIYNSFHIAAAGEQNSDEDDGSGSGDIGLSGFDYDPLFGGSGGSNTTATYRFSAGADDLVFTATLAWNMEIDAGKGSSFSGDATLHNLDITLYDVSNGERVVQASASTIDNTETIWATLDAGTDYMMQVTRQGTFGWDYALAWQSLTDKDGDAVPDTIDVDDDNDGLLDSEEDINGNGVVDAGEADPDNPDTDNDGFDDGMEVTYGSNPLQYGSTPADNVNNDGDINADGMVNAIDVLLATRMALGELLPTAEQQVRADMVPDGVINAGDLLRIQQLALDL